MSKPTKTSKRPRLRDAIRFESNGRVYIAEKDLLASEEFHRSVKRMKKWLAEVAND